ncbi:uncharacterized protein PGRI_041580 [Penicillium griseofulvum]|uniref:GPI anchored serine-rich protein n=1 Tax=Penicillium patulum TaxID=5078 RepID=A0A135L8G4_PENPA|nr:uncharacterized protein PGRI_041580 [Penicillium griseofulvum]KXG45245.1 hypothetical protein PGRI_041580 [Penicillium griseofulvum]
MRFTAVAVAFFAGLAIAAPGADQTVYETEEVTITSCAPTVTDCPGNGAGVEPTASTTPTSVPVAVTSSASSAWTSVPTGVAPSSSSSSSAPVAPPAETAPGSSVIAITTCIPTVIYSTVPVAPTSSPVSSSVIPHGPTGGVPHVPSGTKGVPSGTASVPASTSSPAFNAGSALSGSIGFAGAAAAAAFFLA